jgi:hypothetical protein
MANRTTQEQHLHAERLAVLERFGQAWARADIEQLMSLITDDCVYSASVGPEPGCTYAGRAAVREGFASMLAFDASGEPREGRTFVAGCLAIAEWSYGESIVLQPFRIVYAMGRRRYTRVRSVTLPHATKLTAMPVANDQSRCRTPWRTPNACSALNPPKVTNETPSVRLVLQIDRA